MQSKLLDFNNKFLSFIQEKTKYLTENSLILKNIDAIILTAIGLTLFASTFANSEKLGVLALGVVLLTLIKLVIKQGARIKVSQWDGALFVYFVICFISTINSTLLSQSIHGFLKTVIYIFYYFCVVNYFQTNQDKIRYIFILIAGLCGFESIIAILQNFGGVEQIATWQDSNYINPEDAIARAYGTLKPYNPNLLGGYLIAGLPFVIGSALLFLNEKKYKKALLGLLVFLISSLAIFVTGSRGAYLGLGAILAGALALSWLIIKTDFAQNTKLKEIYQKIIVAISSLFVFILIAVPKITKRLLSIFILRGDSSTSFRMNVYNSSWQMFCDNWFLGIGAGNQTFREIYGLYMLTGYDALSTYSVPLEIAVESGVFGLLSYLIFIALFIINAIKFLKKTCTCVLANKVIVGCAILTIMGVLVHGMFDTIYFRPQVQFLFWTIIAAASGIMINSINQEVKKI